MYIYIDDTHTHSYSMHMYIDVYSCMCVVMYVSTHKLNVCMHNCLLAILLFFCRFKREEAKILAWENHEKAKAEAEMRRIEVRSCLIFQSLATIDVLLV